MVNSPHAEDQNRHSELGVLIGARRAIVEVTGAVPDPGLAILYGVY
jgi:hypothetical protein